MTVPFWEAGKTCDTQVPAYILRVELEPLKHVEENVLMPRVADASQLHWYIQVRSWLDTLKSVKELSSEQDVFLHHTPELVGTAQLIFKLRSGTILPLETTA
jgi:hypothetical protein